MIKPNFQDTQLVSRTKALFNTPTGKEWLEYAREGLFHETPYDMTNPLEYARIDGKCQLIRDIYAMLNYEEQKND